MASKYTYQDFEEAAKKAGLYDQFSSADLKLAASDPDAGMSILSYKTDYGNATTDEARALANAGAENIRSSYGNYTGGADGGNFYADQLSPQSFTADAAPTYTNRYDGTTQGLLNDILNREDFNYDASQDPLYSQYKKQYTREGQRATEDALGAASAASGGIPSSYASTAAGQAGDYYASQLTDKIPDLYSIAYDKYMNDYNMKLNDLSAINTQEQNDYAKYLDSLGQYNTDRTFNYGQLMDEITSQTNERSEALNNALTAADFGDYSQLNGMGINTDNNSTDWERQYQLAQLAAQYGDYSGLNAMGIDTAAYEAALGEANAGSGSSGGSSSRSGSTSTTKLPTISSDISSTESTANTSSTDTAESLKKRYPAGVVTDPSIWKYYLDIYGADALKNAGLSFSTTSPIPIADDIVFKFTNTK